MIFTYIKSHSALDFWVLCQIIPEFFSVEIHPVAFLRDVGKGLRSGVEGFNLDDLFLLFLGFLFLLFLDDLFLDLFGHGFSLFVLRLF